MGVSISYMTPKGEEINITPGFRSMMADLLDRFRGRKLYAYDIAGLKEIAETQKRGKEPEPFDWSQDIHDNIHKIIAAIEKDGWVILTMEW